MTESNPHHSDAKKITTYRHGPIRFLMLFLVCFIVFGIQYAFDIPQALEESLETQLGISQTQFNLLYSVFAGASVVTALIFGFMIDKVGARIMLISLAISIAVFEYLIAIGGYVESFSVILAGRILLGLVCQSLISVQLTMVSHWFKGKQLALAMGIALTSPELGDALNSILTPRIEEATDSLGTPILVSALICTLGIVAAFIVAYLDKRADEVDAQNDVIHTGNIIGEDSSQDQTIHCSQILDFKYSFWLLCTISMIQLAVYVPFLDNGNRLLQKRFCYTQSEAGQIVMSTYLIAAFMSPPLGLLVDKVGERRALIFFSSAVFIIAHAIILFWPQCIDGIVESGVLIGYILLGFGYSLYANCIAPSISLSVKKENTGTAFGILLMMENTALAIFPIISGAIISGAQSPEIGYRQSQLFFECFSLLSLLACLGMFFMSRHCKNKLDANKHQLLIHRIVRKGVQIEITSSGTQNDISLVLQSENEIKKSLLQNDKEE